MYKTTLCGFKRIQGFSIARHSITKIKSTHILEYAAWRKMEFTHLFILSEF